MFDLIVVGAGPAGMACALAVADIGFTVLIIDEQARVGGQIFRRPPAAFKVHSSYEPYVWAEKLIEHVENHKLISIQTRSTVFGVIREQDCDDYIFNVSVQSEHKTSTIKSKKLVIATGAYDKPVAFPGWTKPGVMTVGGAQTLLKSQKVIAGTKVILAGSHPLLVIAAAQLQECGASIEEVIFDRSIPTFTELLQGLRCFIGNSAIYMHFCKSIVSLVGSGAKLSTGKVVSRVGGSHRFEYATVSSIYGKGPESYETREVRGDLLLLGYGFVPSTELLRQIGCELAFNENAGGWIAVHNLSFESTVEGVFVAGEVTGVAGAERSRAEGYAAGLAIAQSLGARLSGYSAEVVNSKKLLKRSEPFAKLVQQIFAPNNKMLSTLSEPADTVVCRCERVHSSSLNRILEDNPFISTVNAVKLECRAGMGLCQGRYCELTVAERVAKVRGRSTEEAGYYSAHLPVKPVPLESYRALGGGK